MKTRKLKIPKSPKAVVELGYKFFGFTLKTTDFRTDPRHIFLFYSDNTTLEQQDVHIIPISDLLQFFIDNVGEGETMFSGTSFREGDGKINSLFHKPDDTWVYNPKGHRSTTQNPQPRIRSEIVFNDWLNENGLRKISNINIENNFQPLQNQIVANKLSLFYNYKKPQGQIITDQVEQQILQFLRRHLDATFPVTVTNQRQNTENIMNQLTQQNTSLRDSISKYFIQFKELRNIF